MLKYELSTALKSKRVIVLFLFFVVLTSYDLYVNYSYNLTEYLRGEVASKPTGKDLYNPCFASFISAASIGNLPQILVTWIFPIYPLFLYSDSFALQKQCGYYNVLLTKADRKRVLFSRFATAFLVPFIIVLVVLFLNFGAANIIFKGGESFAGLEKELERSAAMNFETFSLLHPYIVYVACIFVFATVAGLYGVFCTAVAFVVPKYIIIYPVTFMVWFLILFMPYSVLSVMQIFAGYSTREMIISSVYYILMVVATTVWAFIYKVRYDEL